LKSFIALHPSVHSYRPSQLKTTLQTSQSRTKAIKSDLDEANHVLEDARRELEVYRRGVFLSVAGGKDGHEGHEEGKEEEEGRLPVYRA
jgi:hypothetical protein